MALAGVLTALFRLDTKDAEKSAKRIQRKLGQEVGGALDQVGRKAGIAGRALGAFGPAGLAAAAGAGALATAVGLGTRKLINMGVELTTLRDKTQLSLGFLQEMKFVSDQLNVGFEQVTQSVVRLGRRTAADLPETRRFVEKLGLSMEEIVAMAPEQQFLEIVDAIAQVKNPSEQAAAAMGIFGDAGLQILPLVRNDIEALRDEFDALGGKIDDDVLEAGRKFDDAMTSLKTAAMGLAGEALGPLVETLAEVAEGFLKAQKAGRDLSGSLFDEDPRLRELNREVASIVGPGVANIPGGRERLAELREQIALRKEVLEQRDRLEESLRREVGVQGEISDEVGETGEETKKLVALTQEEARLLGTLKALAPLEELERSRDQMEAFKDETAAATARIDASAQGAKTLEEITKEIEQNARKMDESLIKPLRLVSLREAQEKYNDALAAANDLAQLLGGSLGQILGQTLAAGSALENLKNIGGGGGIGGIFGGLKEAFLQGSGGGKGFLDILGGIGGVAGAAGPLIGIGQTAIEAIAGLFSSGPDLVRDAARDLGATISEEMAQGMIDRGEILEQNLAAIFTAGGFESVDRFAEEIGDAFSALEQGRLSKPELIRTLEESVPLLIQNFEQLGPAGEQQVDRIIAAAQRLGVEFQGLDELISKTFAPETVESMAAKFGKTNKEIREMARALGIDVQTELERTAASVGLTASEFKELGAALEAQFGIPAEQLAEFLEATGISAAELADKLGVDVGEGAKTAADAQAAANERLGEGVGLAQQLAAQLERAARASGGIHIPGGGNVPGAQHGDIVTRPGLRVVGEGGEAEVIAPVRALFDAAMRARGGGGMGGELGKRLDGMAQYINSGQLAKDISRGVRDEVRK